MSVQTIQNTETPVSEPGLNSGRQPGAMSLRGAHLRHRCDLSGCAICNARLSACDACCGLEASLTSVCAGRKLSRFECDEVAAYRMDIVPDDAGGMTVYAIDETGAVVRRPVDGNGGERVAVPAQTGDAGIVAAAPIELCRQAESLAVSIDGDLAIMLRSGTLVELRAGQWHDLTPLLGDRQTVFFQYRADGALNVVTDKGHLSWNGAALLPVASMEYEDAPAALSR